MLEFLFGIITGILVYRALIAYAAYALEKKIDKKVSELMSEMKKSMIDSKIEMANGIYYLYNRDTNEFLAQGATFEELEKAARSKYPNKMFNVPHKELMSAMKGDNNESK